MLTPSWLEQLPETMVNLIGELQNEIIADITKRVMKGKYDAPSTEWLTYKANQLRMSSAEINRIISKDVRKREREIRKLYTESVRLALSRDAEIYRYAIAENVLPDEYGNKLTSYFRSVAFNDVFKAGFRNTNGLMRNLTGSIAANADRVLSDALDLAWLKVSSGAYTHDEAVYDAVSELTDKLPFVVYPSGHKDHIDVAVRRAVRTGVNKTCCDMQLDLAREMDSDLVQVSSHLGARPSHAEWQGQIFSISGKNKKYRPFSDTGYGTGDGLGGWNCRHSFYPYFEGLSFSSDMHSFTDAENKEYYELTQKQRSYERAIRSSKRELAALDAARQTAASPELKAKLDTEFAGKSATLKKREERLNMFCKDNNLAKENERVRVVGFGKSVSQKAVSINKKLLTLGDGDAKIGLKIYEFRQDIANGIINTAVDNSNQQKHTYGKVWKNQVKQAVQSNGRFSPKSVLAKELDPQQLIKKYAGTGDDYDFKGNNKYPDEYIELPFVAGRTYDKKSGKYVETHRVQIKYHEKKGAHIFPILEKGE